MNPSRTRQEPVNGREIPHAIMCRLIIGERVIAPQTEAIQLLAENAIMMASPGGAGFIKVNGTATGGYGD